MVEQDSTLEVSISKTQRRLKVGYVGICYTDRKTIVPTRYSQSPSLQLKGNWLAEAGFETGGSVTVKIMDGCLVLIPDSDETNSLRHQHQRQREQISEIKLRMRELIGDYKSR
ncbi:SymE family type I addiction module toxin [Xenorhabdus cabanillasii]|uniref:Toxin SymE-like domain-containing protein n=1 Tax=Xenorhabdus cabanillasii JM26 TaxID=1427517 RepID=W1J9V8_9GAMM|nr:SymE family type I addiction module toxin [Xenorhabdus cabanillasii]PHM76858.1 endoribonuclease [Xenorhabdus cabanillasii JM26]CDL86671.1 conserved hypothetical protein [Xenorhabdus cabanillasii JM26]